MIDAGCGKGYFAVPFSHEVGPKGKVFAADTSEDMLISLRQTISQTANLVPVLSEEFWIPL